MKKVFLFVAMGICLCMSASSVQAVTIYADINPNPGFQDTLYDPGLGAWVVRPDSNVTSPSPRDYTVDMAITSWGAFENDFQLQDIYGAGVILPTVIGTDSVLAYRVDFTTALYTWDSYRATDLVEIPSDGPPNGPPDGGEEGGYWDGFFVNMNDSPVPESDGFYWDHVDVLGGANTDPIVTPDPAGNVVQPGDTGYASTIPGVTWAWGGYDFTAEVGNFEFEVELVTPYSLVFDLPVVEPGPVYLSLVLDTATSPETDNEFPSFGSFNPVGDGPPPPQVPIPGAIWLFGFGLMGLLGLKGRFMRS